MAKLTKASAKFSLDDLNELNAKVYQKCGYHLENPRPELESVEYSACEFNLDHLAVRFRKAKVTPTKIGQFVTFWKRSETNGPIQPFDASDKFDVLIVAVRTRDNFGQFIFPKSVLVSQDIISEQGQGGRRALRVYPPWDITTSAQAKKTQKWQLEFFHDISTSNNVDLKLAKKLLTLDDISFVTSN